MDGNLKVVNTIIVGSTAVPRKEEKGIVHGVKLDKSIIKLLTDSAQSVFSSLY